MKVRVDYDRCATGVSALKLERKQHREPRTPGGYMIRQAVRPVTVVVLRYNLAKVPPQPSRIADSERHFSNQHAHSAVPFQVISVL